jgi:hypothetical protein
MSTPAPDYGEPWSADEMLGPHGHSVLYAFDSTRLADFRDKDHARQARRTFACVNACAGMADPEKEIAAMRDAIKSADHALTDLVEHIGLCSEHDLLKCDADPHPPSVFSVYASQSKAAPAKLQPFIKP